MNQNAKQWPAGYALFDRQPGPSDEWLEKFRNMPASWVSDSYGRTLSTVGLNTYHNDINLMMVGRAVTVKVRPGDNLMVHKAIEIAKKDDVIVVDGGADRNYGLIGGNVRMSAIHKGLAGFVIDGAIRDLVDWAKGGVPVWARAHSHRGPSKEGPGEVNVPIVCAGLVINPGDLIVGDADGIVAVPPSDIETVWAAIQITAKKEEETAEKCRTGTVDPERFNSILRAKGCPV